MTKKIRVACCECGEKSRLVLPRSPAAPVLTALEQLEKEGWAYQIGFFAMLTGDHRPVCPQCNGGARVFG
jgi:hypothetical protein